jgi:hypothetical protein
MCDDVPAFADASVALLIGLSKKFFMMVGFSGDLLGGSQALADQAL